MTLLRYRRKPLLYALLAIAVFSVGICSLAMSVLNVEQEGATTQRGQWPVRVSGNSHREILNVVNDMSQTHHEKVPLSSDYSVTLHSDKKTDGQDDAVGEIVTVTERVAEKDAIEMGAPAPSSCNGPWPRFPSCQIKMEWMADNWRKDSCYTEHGVDGTSCSYQHYLSEVEHWCPTLGSKQKLKAKAASIQDSLAPLLDKMSHNSKFNWLKRRISGNWHHWTTAVHSLERQAPFNHSRKNVLIHIGALSDKAGFKFAENADHGGPLGELVQWSDLIASLHILGHALDFSTELGQLKTFLSSMAAGSCPTKLDSQYNVIYIDIVGLRQFKRLAKNRIQHFQCLFRVLDSFGTEPQFNYKKWKPSGRKKGDYGQEWGNWNFNPRQFLTMYPHTPDNSFLGFVVGNNKKNAVPLVKKNIGLVYGKELYMWEGKRKYLDVISRYIDIHATIGTTQRKKNIVDSSVVPGYVINHGILNSTALQALLAESKVFIGMGFPYEGPAPLEAIANGCFFLNPKLSPPLNRDNSKFLKGKPTLRSLTSQNPYTENFIAEPSVHTFDMDDSQSIIRIMEYITETKTPVGYLPYEFTFEGMLERVLVYLENQDFCSSNQWPRKEVLVAKVSKEDESCKDACFREGLACEPELFPFLNRETDVVKEFGCRSVSTENSVHGPSYNSQSRSCSLQSLQLLHSCVGSSPNTQRLCPCRTYRKGQVALCSTCNR